MKAAALAFVDHAGPRPAPAGLVPRGHHRRDDAGPRAAADTIKISNDADADPDLDRLSLG
jgi:hypothetical protein